MRERSVCRRATERPGLTRAHALEFSDSAMSGTVSLLRRHGVVVVVGAPREEIIIEWSAAAADGGIRMLAIPVDCPCVTEVASDLVDDAELSIGVSGIVSVDSLMIAVAAGARFVLSPICDRAILDAARARGIDVILGAATPNEIVYCASLQPDAIAVHPVGVLGGPAYFKTIQNLAGAIPIIASGSVDVEHAPSYLEAGALGAVVDSGVFPADLDPEAHKVIAMRAMALTEVCNEVLGRDPKPARPSIRAAHR
jgi:2-dehydro-3-deoxyphosphogluconate aldolase / (4S)-4-hydroxy-2-oxoglutarate aldolase